MAKSINQIALDIIRIEAGEKAYNRIAEILEGSTVYFGKDIESRNREIRDAFYKGADRKQLAKQYKLSLQTIYKITETKS